MSRLRSALLAAALSLAGLAPAMAAPCGGDFGTFLAAIKAEAMAGGQSAQTVDAFLKGAAPDARVLKADRAQGVFRKSFLDFSQSLISSSRIKTGAAKSKSHDAIFARAERDYGVSRGILLAFWAFETDYGQVQGDFNTRNALLTLAHDCRRPALFRPQVLAAIEMFRLGEFPLDTTGAWAGEIGMVQMLPADILARGVDGDGDGKVTLKTSAADAILSGAAMLRHHGWRAGEPWMTEIALPDGFDYALSGLSTERSTADWDRLGVVARPGLPCLSELPRPVRMEQELRLCHHGGLFRHPASGRTALSRGQPRPGPFGRGDDGPAKEAGRPGA